MMAIHLLLHGGSHRPDQWDLLVPELERLGHETVAPDLPMDDASVGVEAWADAALAALGDRVDEPGIRIVGHSYAGLGVPVIASRLRAPIMVFLGAQVPVPGVRYLDWLAGQDDAILLPPEARQRDEQGRTVIPSWEIYREHFALDVPEEIARAAFARLRPNAPTAFTEVCPIEEWPDARSEYILGTEDRAVGPSFSRRVSAERLRCVPIELPGGHSLFWSRPAELAAAIDGIR